MKNPKLQTLNKIITTIIENRGFKKRNRDLETKIVIYLKSTKRTKRPEKLMIMQIKLMVIYKSIFGSMLISWMGKYKKYLKK